MGYGISNAGDMIRDLIEADKINEHYTPYANKLGIHLEQKPLIDGKHYTDKAEILRVTGLPEEQYKGFVAWCKRKGLLERKGQWWIARTGKSVVAQVNSNVNDYLRIRQREDSFAMKLFSVEEIGAVAINADAIENVELQGADQ